MSRVFLWLILLLLTLSPKAWAAQFISGEDFHSLATIQVENYLNLHNETRRHEIEFTQMPYDIKIPDGTVDIKADSLSTISLTSVTPIRMHVFVDGKLYRDVNFIVRVRVFDKVIVANHDLRIEVPVSEADFHVEEIAIDGRNNFLKDAKEISGLVPHRYIRAGSPVTTNYFQQPVVVHSGQSVRIIVRYGNIDVSANGIVLARGRIGELVKVKNETSQKIVTARVIDAGTVEVVT